MSVEKECVIGLEIHAQPKTGAKLFCDCSADYQKAGGPNENVCPTCTAQPGAKPFAVNERAVRQAVMVALALGCEKISERVVMQRKHYFYPDLPSNYQRTSTPVGERGALCGVGVWEVHLEEDPGRYDLKTGLVDYNRSGVPLIEIVTAPEITSPDHARKLLDEMRAILEYLGASRGADEGAMRADANISIPGHKRVEVKNINSSHGVFSALTYELSRQRNMAKNGLEILQETRHFDEDREITVGLRRKETVDDYRYIPDPDVQPIEIPKETVEKIRAALPELPTQKMRRLERQYGVSKEESHALCLEQAMADDFEKAAKVAGPKLAAVFMRGVLKKQLNYRGMGYAKFQEAGGFSALREILSMLRKGETTGKIAELLLAQFLDKKITGSVEKHARSSGLSGVEGSAEVERMVEKVFESCPKAVGDYLAGNAKALHYLAGKVMDASKGRADPGHVHKTLAKKIRGKVK